ncbi:MAG TPA: type II secretion system secretin GspD [Xanthomonadaceae bacterium]|nr:type II secretion system secretin GspD [Xanthomonadaceae bacterium]
MNRRPTSPRVRALLRSTAAAVLAGLLAACASAPVARIQRGATAAPATGAGAVDKEALPAEATGPVPVIRRGTGQVINQAAASAPPPRLGGTTGEATFNFEGESVQAVTKAILGDMLGQNYVIAPGVQGTVTYVTSRPVSPAEALSLLEMVLGWNNARLVYADGRYNIVPSDDALAGTVAPRTGGAAMARGFESRVVPLRYVSATEMKKILEPFARKNAVVNADPGRNTITVAGTRAELENYLRTIQIFDVDWMSSMSVGVFPLQSGKASQVVADLEKVFGEQSKSPVAGMFRFMPLEAANAVMVITSQPDYLDDIQQWLERIDGAGGGVQLFSYELKYIKAKDLADRLAEVFGGSAGRGGGSGGPTLMPGLESTEIRDSGVDDSSGVSSARIGGDTPGGTGSDSAGGIGEGMSLGQATSGNGTVTLQVNGDQVGVSAVGETNSLLVRATPQAWKSIREVVEKLDVMPLQVHIEAQVAQVALTGDLRYGVSWFFEQAVNTPVAEGGAGLPSAVGRDFWGDIAGSIKPAGGINPGLAWTFLGRNAAAVINALDQVTDIRLLQTPSVMVRNNSEATLNVGTRIPISSVTFNPGGVPTTGEGTFSQVQYLDTGVILKVRPRVTKDGMVFLDLVQEVSQPTGEPDPNGNVRISSQKLKTEAAVQSGDTVMLAGLISDGTTRGGSGVPGLSRIPILGALFGTQSSSEKREETIILITPTVIRDPQEARDLTDEYGRRFRALEPLYVAPKE